MMLTEKRKLRDRKQKFQKVYIFLGLIVFGGILAYVTSLKLFSENGYISPLSSHVLSDTSYQEEKALDVIRESLEKNNIEVTTVDRKNETYIIRLESNAEVVLSAKKDLNEQISSLQFILQRLTMEGRRFSRLDLRFDKPAIVLEK